MTNPSDKERIDWQDEFDEKFTSDWWYGFGSTDDINNQGIESIKSFISTLLQKKVKEIESKVMNLDLTPDVEDHVTLKELENSFSGFGYGQAWMMKRFLSILNQTKE